MRQREETAGLILLIEDNRGIAEMVGEFLERLGYSLDYAADGVTGLRLATQNSYDVIVLDLMLPGLDGLELCRRLRNEAKRSTPVLMLNDNASPTCPIGPSSAFDRMMLSTIMKIPAATGVTVSFMA